MTTYTDEQILDLYEATFGPLRNPDPGWLYDAVSWCRRVLDARDLPAAAGEMAAWAADGDLAAARASAAALRQSAGLDGEVAPALPPRPMPPAEVLADGPRLLARRGWAWWQDHRLPVWVDEGTEAGWRRVFADGELLRAWAAAGWAVLPDTTDPAVQGWARLQLRA